MEESNLNLKKLYLLRHSDAEDLSADKNDFDRNLSQFGIEKARIFGQNHLINLKPDFILCSSANRARQTLQLVNFKQIVCSFKDDLYMADLNSLLNLIQSVDDKYNNLLVVGHNNGISELVTYTTDENIILSTCESVEIELEIRSWNHLSQETGITRRKFH